MFVLTAPDVTPHQRDVLDHRFRMYRTGRKSMVQMISMNLSEALWPRLHPPGNVSYAGSIYHSANAPKISLPPVLHMLLRRILRRWWSIGARRIYLSRISPCARWTLRTI